MAYIPQKEFATLIVPVFNLCGHQFAKLPTSDESLRGKRAAGTPQGSLAKEDCHAEGDNARRFRGLL